MKVVLDLKTCKKCPYVKDVITRNSGHAVDYHCSFKERNSILVTGYSDNAFIRSLPKVMGYVESKSDEKPIPDWCPIKLD